MRLLTLATAGLLALATASGRQSADPPFAEILHMYRSGDADAAVALFAAWPGRRVVADARVPSDRPHRWDRAALLLLHHEAEAAGSRAFATHYSRDAELVEQLDREAREAGDRDLLLFARDVSLASLNRNGTLDIWKSLADRFPDDALVQLALGARMEYASPRIEGGLPNEYWFGDENVVHVTSHGRFGPEPDQAISRFRRALTLDPGLAEARLRLGRVLWLLDRRDDAAPEWLEVLRQGARSSGLRSETYLANLFLGRLYEEQHDVERAERVYRDALTALPDGQAARIALGRLLVDQERDAEGWASAALPIDRPPDANAALDPWTVYFSNQYGGIELRARLRALRPRIRQ